MPVIAVVVPAYRAAATIGDVLRAIPATVQWIVVVDDGGADDLPSAVRGVADERVEVVRHERNRGVGAAVLTGYQRALELGADIIVKIDADGQMDPTYLPQLVAPVADGAADYAKGNRFLHGRELRSMPTTRRYGNVGLSFLTKLATGYWPVFDPTNGYTAIHASVANLLDRSKIAERYFFETSMLIALSGLRAVVTDVYIPARYTGAVSSLRPGRAAVGFPLPLLRAFLERIRLEYFVRDFTAVSLYIVAGIVLLTFGVVWGIWHWVASVQTGVPATTGTVMIAVLPVILGMQLLLQAATLDIQGVPSRVIQTRRG
ncbi:MAG: glycosyltransferase family 2 protein [Chloroflexota bacterium]|nr:glycosyltransferase family 2 protein [Chloroflexota bacterium]